MGILAGILRGIFLDHKIKAQTFSGKSSEHFSQENSQLKKNLPCKIRSADVPP